MNNPTLKFARTQAEFFPVLTKRVNAYFTSNDIQRTANTEMVIKTIFMFTLYFTPYVLLMSGLFTSLWAFLALCVVMGLGKAGIGLSVMHDANHGSYSSKPWLNNILGFSMNLIGGNAFNWVVQHNVLHHTYTNVHEVDEDISPRGVLRMAPDSEWKSFHRFQHLYAWFLYGMLTFVWIVFKDYNRLARYHRDGLVKRQKSSIVKEWTVLILSKLVYFGYAIALPIILLPVAWWQVLIGFFVMHYVAGFILAIIFQPAHVIEGTEYPMPDDGGNLEFNWAVHQLQTTTNFGHKHRIFSWYVGGLNYQVEHHLFPNICHVHYRKIACIVEATAREYNIPYKSKNSFMEAVAAHARLLRELGKKPLPSIPARVVAAA